jgi:novobiocin biosynthesis protein NovU/D-mycarose 3-C-methyltransferase
VRFLELGPTPLANSFLNSLDEAPGERSYPLDLYFCRTCSLIQLLDVIDAEVLFRDYIYLTGTSDTITAHNRAYAEMVADRVGLRAADLVVEIASNNGALLACFDQPGIRTLGIEPARNIADLARANGIETISEFFEPCLAERVRADYGPARVVIANNVLAHVDEPREFLSAARGLLGPGGLVIVEVPYLADLVERLEYDTVYHEHLSYFSVNTLARLCEEVGLALVRVEHVPVHGGSLRMYAQTQSEVGGHAPEVVSQRDAECREGLTSFGGYQQFAAAVGDNRRAVRRLLESLVGAGHSVAGYGAPAKGNTLLNYCGIGTDLLPYTVDKSPLKVGRLTPGQHIPVLPVETLLDRQPDYVLILAWNFADEIMRQQRTYAQRGGRFILPLPQPRIV